MRHRIGFAAQVMPEPDAEGRWTWMEVYPEGWTHREPQVAAAMAAWIATERKVERFEMLG